MTDSLILKGIVVAVVLAVFLAIWGYLAFVRPEDADITEDEEDV